jgi:hypothetical protein
VTTRAARRAHERSGHRGRLPVGRARDPARRHAVLSTARPRASRSPPGKAGRRAAAAEVRRPRLPAALIRVSPGRRTYYRYARAGRVSNEGHELRRSPHSDTPPAPGSDPRLVTVALSGQGCRTHPNQRRSSMKVTTLRDQEGNAMANQVALRPAIRQLDLNPPGSSGERVAVRRSPGRIAPGPAVSPRPIPRAVAR